MENADFMIDYHVHSLLCNHAEGPMTAYVEQAITMGLSEICFLDHLSFAPGASRHSMAVEEVPLYFHGIQRLKHLYHGLIDIKAGLEVDFDPAYTFLTERIIETYAFDLIGGSVHFQGDLNLVSRKEAARLAGADGERICRGYIESLDRMLDSGLFDMVCHLDVLKKHGPDLLAPLPGAFDGILDKIAERNVAVEINTSGYDHPAGESYPGKTLLEELRRRGIPITLGSDAHRPCQVGRHFDRILSYLRRNGFDSLTTFTRRKAAPLPL